MNWLTNISKSRAEFAADLFERYRKAYPRYNVMVVSSDHDASHLEEVIKHETHQYTLALTYHVYVFKRGRFVLLGEGGFDNWHFGENFERRDHEVFFKD